MLETILARRILQKLDCIAYPLGIEIGSGAFAKSQAETVAQRVAGGLGELDSPQTVSVQVSIRVDYCFVCHARRRLARSRPSWDDSSENRKNS